MFIKLYHDLYYVTLYYNERCYTISYCIIKHYGQALCAARKVQMVFKDV